MYPWILRIAAVGVVLLVSSLQAEKKPQDLLPADALPAKVIDAAKRELPGASLIEARRMNRKAGAIYRVTAVLGHQEQSLTVDASGRVLKVNRPKGEAAAAYDGPFQHTGTITHQPVRESSGIIASRQHRGVYWTHNDRGNAAAIYAINAEGKVLREFPVEAGADDWEDIATDDAGNLYIGNIGNNNAARKTLEVHRIAEPNPALPAARLRAGVTWRLRFPVAPFDCESLFIHQGHGYVVSKHFDGTAAAIYGFALDGARDVVLERVAALPIRTPVTAADLTTDGRQLAVLSSAGLHLFDLRQGLQQPGAPRLIAVPPGKLEGVCFGDEGLLLTSEGRQVYRLPK